MKKILVFCYAMLICLSLSAQYIYPEHYNERPSQFCLDCGEPQAMPPADMLQQMMTRFNKKALQNIDGDIYLQVLVDSVGNARLLSADNQTNVKSKKLRLRTAVNAVRWTPAGGGGVQSVQILLTFHEGNLSARRMTLKFKDPEGHHEPKHLDTSLSYQWQVYNTSNSSLPQNMSRAVAIDSNGLVWMGTDKGLVKFDRGFMQVYNQRNSPLVTYERDTTDLQSIMALDFDSHGRLWISQGYYVFMLDNGKWIYFDENNSPLTWCTKFNYDKCGNLWIPTSKGAHRYVDGKWNSVDSTTYPLPSNKIMSIYVDSRHRVWIGTAKGSIMVDGEKMETFENTQYPIKNRTISHILEDKNGNIWLAFYGDEREPTTALMRYDTDGKWHKYNCPLIKNWKSETIADIILNEQRGELWLSVYHIGLLLFSMDTGKWELYTPDNSSIPSGYIEGFDLSSDGTLWAATFGGFVKSIYAR